MTTLTLSRNAQKQITFEDLKGLRAEGYIRDSTLDQRNGFGPDLQRKAIEGFANTYSLELGSAWYTDFITGTSTLKRSGFKQAIQEAQIGRFDVFLVYHTSRFARNRADAIRYKEELKKLGKFVVFVSQGIISGNDNDFLNEGMNEVLDEQYSRNLSRYVAEGNARKSEAGIALGHAPLGYRHIQNPNGKGVIPVPDDKTMPALLALLEGYASGLYSYQTLANHLNALGLRTRRGQLFSMASVTQVIENRFYEGKVVYHPRRRDKEVREGIHEVPAEVKKFWLTCQEVRERRALPWARGPRTNSRVYLFSGILSCAVCGSRYKGLAAYHGPANLRQRLVHKRDSCSIRPRSQRMETLSRQFAARLLPFFHLEEDFQERVMHALGDDRKDPNAEGQTQRVERALDQIRKQNQWGDLSDQDYIKERDSLRRRLQNLKAASPSVHAPNLKRTAEFLMDMPALWQHPAVEDEQRNRMLQEVFDDIQIEGRELVAVKPKPEYAPHFAYITLVQRGCLTSGYSGISKLHLPMPLNLASCYLA